MMHIIYENDYKNEQRSFIKDTIKKGIITHQNRNKYKTLQTKRDGIRGDKTLSLQAIYFQKKVITYQTG